VAARRSEEDSIMENIVVYDEQGRPWAIRRRRWVQLEALVNFFYADENGREIPMSPGGKFAVRPAEAEALIKAGKAKRWAR
jgi:hypothetical protein